MRNKMEIPIRSGNFFKILEYVQITAIKKIQIWHWNSQVLLTQMILTSMGL